MASQHLKLVGSQPKTSARREKDSERYRVKSFLADVLLKEDRAHEILEIQAFVDEYQAFPTTSEEVVNAIFSTFPKHVICRAQDRFSLTSLVTNRFKERPEVHLPVKSKGGGTWERRPEIKRARNPRVSRSASASVSPYGADDRISRIESKVESLSNTVDKLVKSLGGV